jgi:predicted adenylyl cyclase CyaB
MAVPRRNLELKARDADPQGSLETCGSLGAEDKGVLHQKDTYFKVPRGRLKLRRERGATAHLIAYERPDLPDQKESRYRIVEIENASGLEVALAGTVGVTAVVAKARRLFLLEGVRIHLDSVDGLGSFIELEGVADPRNVDFARLEALLVDLRHSFGIEDADLVDGSYCDLVLAAAAP